MNVCATAVWTAVSARRQAAHRAPGGQASHACHDKTHTCTKRRFRIRGVTQGPPHHECPGAAPALQRQMPPPPRPPPRRRLDCIPIGCPSAAASRPMQVQAKVQAPTRSGFGCPPRAAQPHHRNTIDGHHTFHVVPCKDCTPAIRRRAPPPGASRGVLGAAKRGSAKPTDTRLPRSARTIPLHGTRSSRHGGMGRRHAAVPRCTHNTHKRGNAPAPRSTAGTAEVQLRY